ncbi:MAG: NAD+ synthase [Beijerinckiaceae bacterium]
MTDILKIALAQLNPVVGDIAGNAAKARSARAEAARMGADILVLSELFIAAYPPDDMVLKAAFTDACRAAIEELARETADGGPAVIIGTPWSMGARPKGQKDAQKDGQEVYNAVCVLMDGRIAAVRFKNDLPNYGVFDEKRVFDAGPMPGSVSINGVRIGIPICEDIWGPDVVECLAETGAEILIVPNASPYRRGRMEERLNTIVARVTESGLPLIYVNQVGGQDELVFDGGSLGLNADRSLAFQLPAFAETIALTTWRREKSSWICKDGPVTPVEDGDEADYEACVLGLRDYVDKNRFPGVVLGLSGGIDSAICAVMAVDALGADRVHCVMMPYLYTARDSLEDAHALAEATGVRYDIVPIKPAVEGLEACLAPLFAGRERDLTEENLQSRARGTILMSISNKFGPMVVTTGNKSEMSVGYCTLYGDMNGGFNPIKDLDQMEVVRLCALRNRWTPAWAQGPAGTVIPENILLKPPSAELRENQKDQDSLPPYDILDAILVRLVEHEMRISDIVADGYEIETVRKIERLLTIAEFKRRQSAPGVKVTTKAFGRERRYPIVNRFRDPGTAALTPDASIAPEVVKAQTDVVDF